MKAPSFRGFGSTGSVDELCWRKGMLKRFARRFGGRDLLTALVFRDRQGLAEYSVLVLVFRRHQCIRQQPHVFKMMKRILRVVPARAGCQNENCEVSLSHNTRPRDQPRSWHCAVRVIVGKHSVPDFISYPFLVTRYPRSISSIAARACHFRIPNPLRSPNCRFASAVEPNTHCT